MLSSSYILARSIQTFYAHNYDMSMFIARYKTASSYKEFFFANVKMENKG